MPQLEPAMPCSNCCICKVAVGTGAHAKLADVRVWKYASESCCKLTCVFGKATHEVDDADVEDALDGDVHVLGGCQGQIPVSQQPGVTQRISDCSDGEHEQL